MTIVITGGTGFVGRHLADELKRTTFTDRIIVWDQVPAELPGVEMVVVDITKPASYEQSLRQCQPTWLVHLAGVAPVGESFKDPARTQAVNTTATEGLLTSLGRYSPATKVLAVSSADIYGQGSPTPLPELPLTAATPMSPYAKSKWAMEKMIEASFNDRVIRVRPFPHIGPGQQRGFVTADFASQIASIEAGLQPAVINVGDLRPQRDFTDVRDVARAYRLLLQRGELGEVYHVASGRAVSIAEILDQLLALARRPITVAQDPALVRPSDIPVLVGDAGKLRAATGWQPEISLTQSLTDILNFWRERVHRAAA